VGSRYTWHKKVNSANRCALLSLISGALYQSSAGHHLERISVEDGTKTSYIEILKNRSLFFVLVAMILFVDAQATVLNYFPLYAKSIGISRGLFSGLAVGLAVVIRLFGGTYPRQIQ
jgi:fucose permease